MTTIEPAVVVKRNQPPKYSTIPSGVPGRFDGATCDHFIARFEGIVGNSFYDWSSYEEVESKDQTDQPLFVGDALSRAIQGEIIAVVRDHGGCWQPTRLLALASLHVDLLKAMS